MSDLSSYKIERIFVDAIKEVVEKIQDDMKILDDFNVLLYRNQIQDIVMEKSEYLKKMFKGDIWAKFISTGNAIPVLFIDSRLENIFKRAMEYFNEENQHLMHVFKTWEEKHDNFKMASVYAEKYMGEEEYIGYEEKFKKLINDYAKKLGISKFRAKLEMPPFDNIIDKIEWLEKELDDVKTSDIVKDIKIDTEAIDKGEAKENPKIF